MTFVCPVCKEIASSKHAKLGKPMKKGKNWRERDRERVVQAVSVSGVAD
jgi:hypothetical protein